MDKDTEETVEEQTVDEEEKIDVDLGDINTFFVANNGNYFGVAFNKLFEQEQLGIYNIFEMSSKRNFKNLTPMILSTYEELFLDESGGLRDDCELIFFKLLKAKSDIMVAENGTSYDEFIADLEEIMKGGDNLLINIIKQYVTDNYSLNLDKITSDTKAKNRKVNAELQFSDAHARDLLKIAYLYRVMIPLISVYFYYNKSSFSYKNEAADGQPSEEDAEELKFEEVNSSIFAYLFDKICDNPEALRSKLYRLTYSGVSKTSYSDKRFWLAAKNVSITEKTEALDIYKKILTNAIPKLSIDGDKNVISFLQSVINNQVDFLFQNKFKYHFIALGNNGNNVSVDDSDDDSNMSDFERIEIQQSRNDEGAYIIRKLNIKSTLEEIPEKMNVGVSDAEVKEAINTIKRNPIQEQIIATMTFKYFGDKDALKFVTFYQYCFLLIACKKYLVAHKFIYLPLILTANCEKHRERVNISGKKVRPEILNSKKYTDLLSKKYTNFSDEIEKPFLAFIGSVYSSVFKNEKGEEIFDSSVKVGKIAEEVVDLANL